MLDIVMICLALTAIGAVLLIDCRRRAYIPVRQRKRD